MYNWHSGSRDLLQAVVGLRATVSREKKENIPRCELTEHKKQKLRKSVFYFKVESIYKYKTKNFTGVEFCEGSICLICMTR